MKHEIIFKGEFKRKPHCAVMIKPVIEGLWLVYVDFYERFSYDGEQYAYEVGKPRKASLMFSLEKEGISGEIEIEIDFREGFVIGSMSKKTFHGFLMTTSTYLEIMKEKE